MSRPDITVLFGGRLFSAEVYEDLSIPIMEGGVIVGTAKWDKRKRMIRNAPATLPPGVLVALTQKVRTALISKRLEQARIYHERPNKHELNKLFRLPTAPEYPPNCTRWAIVEADSSVFVALVLDESDLYLFRSWFYQGKASWTENGVDHYVGIKVPEYVWVRLTAQLSIPPTKR